LGYYQMSLRDESFPHPPSTSYWTTIKCPCGTNPFRILLSTSYWATIKCPCGTNPFPILPALRTGLLSNVPAGRILSASSQHFVLGYYQMSLRDESFPHPAKPDVDAHA